MSAKPWSGKTVVIIDDSANVRSELQRAFEGCGMRVVGVGENGVIGLALVEKHNPEIVSIDIIMPEMDGIECYRKIKAFSPDMKCIMISWLSGEPKILENLKDLIPSYCFQTKPASAADLGARLQKVYFPETAVEAPKDIDVAGDEAAADFLGDLGVKVS